MHRRIPRLRASGSLIVNNLTAAQLKRKAMNMVSAVHDTFYSTKEIFERHRVVFTICTSIASIATAWAGYTLRHLHESRIDQRLESIEKASFLGLDLVAHGIKSVKINHELDVPELKKLASRTVSFPACVATAGTSLIIGYGLGWRGGAWFTNRKFRREQMKLMGQINPKRWPLKFLRRPLIRVGAQESAKVSEPPEKNPSTVRSSAAATSSSIKSFHS